MFAIFNTQTSGGGAAAASAQTTGKGTLAMSADSAKAKRVNNEASAALGSATAAAAVAATATGGGGSKSGGGGKKKQKTASSRTRTRESRASADVKRKHNYGFNPAQTRALLEKQGHQCPGCGAKLQEYDGELVFEHKHKLGTKDGKVVDLYFDLGNEEKRLATRSLSCQTCNTAYGRLEPLLQDAQAMKNLLHLKAWRQSKARSQASITREAAIAFATAGAVKRRTVHAALVAAATAAKAAAKAAPAMCPDCNASFRSSRRLREHRFGKKATCRANPDKLSHDATLQQALALVVKKEQLIAEQTNTLTPL